MDRKLLGQRIAERRNYMGLNQEELGAMLHVTRESISNWETGRRGIDAVDLQKVAAALDTSIAYFYGEDVAVPAVESRNSAPTDVERRLSGIEEQLSEVLERLRQADKSA